MTGPMLFSMGEQDGKVVLNFPKPITEIAFDPENARALAEQLARHAYHLHSGLEPMNSKSYVSEIVRKDLHKRCERIIHSMRDKPAAIVAWNVVDQILKEVT